MDQFNPPFLKPINCFVVITTSMKFFLNCELLILHNNFRIIVNTLHPHYCFPSTVLHDGLQDTFLSYLERMISFIQQDVTNGFTSLLSKIVHIKKEKKNHGILKKENCITENITKAHQVQQMGHNCFPKGASNLSREVVT